MLAYVLPMFFHEPKKCTLVQTSTVEFDQQLQASNLSQYIYFMSALAYGRRKKMAHLLVDKVESQCNPRAKQAIRGEKVHDNYWWF